MSRCCDTKGCDYLIDVNKAIEILKQRRSVFTSEADLQLEFGWVLKELYPDYRVRMEYCPKVDRNIHIDILVISNNGCIPIELKYKTKSSEIKVADEEYVLKNHGAKDQGCYKYLNDIQRIERLKKSLPDFVEGYAIMLTNESSYLSEPSKLDCAYAEYSIHEGAIKRGTNASAGTKRGCENPIELYGEYIMHWNEYSKIYDAPGGVFYITINKIA